MTNPKYLRRHFNTWVMHLKVPKDMIQHEGRKYIDKSLKTGDRKAAIARRDIELGRLQERWARLREGASDDPATLDWLRAGAADIRDRLRAGEMPPEEADTIIGELVDRHLRNYASRPDAKGSYPEEEFNLADDHAERIRHAVSSITRPPEPTISEVAKVYLAETQDRVTTKTYNEKRKYIDLLVEHAGPERPIRKFDQKAAREFIGDVLLKLPTSAATRRKIFSIVNAFGEWTVPGYLTVNPIAGMGKRIKAPVKGVRRKDQRRPWTTEELLKLFSFEGVNLRYWKVWYGCALLLLTGARRGEILNLRVENIVHDGKGLDVRNAKNTDSLRVIPLHPLAQPLVKKLAEKSSDGYLLAGYPAGGPDSDDRGNAFLKQFSRVRKVTTGIGAGHGLDIHSFRHTFETAAANRGLDQRVINEIMGHANDSGTGQRVYLHGIEFNHCLMALKKLSFGRKVDRLLAHVPTVLRQ